MKLWCLFLTFLISSQLYSQDHTPFNKGGLNLSEFKFDEKSFFYPAYQLMMAFKDNKPQKAVAFCTEELLYKKDSISDNFYFFYKEKFFNSDYTDSSKIKVIFIKKKEEERVQITLPNKINPSHTNSVLFKIKKINGKYKIYYIY